MSGDRACAHEGAPSADECARSTRQPEPRLNRCRSHEDRTRKGFLFLCSGQSHRKTPKIEVVISVRMRRAAKRHSFHNCNGPQLILGRGYHMFGWTRNTIPRAQTRGIQNWGILKRRTLLLFSAPISGPSSPVPRRRRGAWQQEAHQHPKMLPYPGRNR